MCLVLAANKPQRAVAARWTTRWSADVRPFAQAELPSLDEIDRSEVIEALYRVERGTLVKNDDHIDVPGWRPGDGEHSVGRMRAFAAEHLAAGTEGIVALSDGKLREIGVVGFQPHSTRCSRHSCM